MEGKNTMEVYCTSPIYIILYILWFVKGFYAIYCVLFEIFYQFNTASCGKALCRFREARIGDNYRTIRPVILTG